MRAAQRLSGASSIASRNFFDQAVPAKEADPVFAGGGGIVLKMPEFCLSRG